MEVYTLLSAAEERTSMFLRMCSRPFGPKVTMAEHADRRDGRARVDHPNNSTAKNCLARLPVRTMKSSSSPATDFPPDNPSFWMEFHSLRQETNKFELSLARQLEDFGSDCGTTSKDHYETLKQLVNESCWADAPAAVEDESVTTTGSGSPPSSPRGLPCHKPLAAAPFLEFTDALLALNQHRAKLTAAFRNWHDASAKLQEETHSLETKFREFKHLESRYKKKVEKYLGLKPGTTDKKLTAMASKMHFRKQLLEIKRLELWTVLRNISVGQELVLLKPFTQVMTAFQELCVEGSKICAPLTEKIARMESEVARDVEEVAGIREKNIALMKKKGDEYAHNQRTASSFVSEVRSDVRSTGIRDVDAAEMTGPKTTATEFEGQLYYPSPAFQPVWVRLRRGKLTIEAEGVANKTVDVLLCTIKEKRDSKLRFVFEIISPMMKIQLQALSSQDLNHWLNVIQNAVSLQLNSQGTGSKSGIETGEFPTPNDTDLSHQLDQLRAIAGNELCADCLAEKPEWLSLNLGIMICLTCSGVHRSLGTHISKVRSANLDKIDPSMMAYLESMGNTNVNAIWEGKIQAKAGGVKRPQIVGTDKAIRNMWITTKYQLKHYVLPPPEYIDNEPQLCYSCTKAGFKVDPMFEGMDETKLQTVRDCLGNVQCKKINQQVDLNLKLFDAIRKGSPLEAMKCLSWGAEVNANIGFTKGEHPECFDGKTALHQVACDAECPSRLVLAEMIIANSANSQSRDCRGWTALHYAAYNQDVAMVELLLNRGGKNLISLVDRDKKRPRTALHVALLTDPENPTVPLLMAAEQEFNRKGEQKTATNF